MRAQPAISFASAATLLATKVFGDLADLSILLVGSGQIAELAAKHLQAARAAPVRVTDRSPKRARELGARLGAEVTDFGGVYVSLASADVVVCSSASSKYIFTKENVAPVLRHRRFRPLLMVDFALPGDIAPNLNELENVFTYDLYDIQRMVARAA